MIVSLLITVEGSRPEMSRLINVEDSTDLGELSNVIEAAFGFSGMAPHMYMDSTGPTRNVYAPQPSAGEIGERTVTVADIGPTTYVYDTAANWNLAIEPLGQSEIDGPTPLLVDTQGPDVVEACGGPAMMTRFHREARRLSAGLVPDMEIAPLLLSFLPVMSPERILQRLTHSDHVTVSERISYVAEEIHINAVARAAQDPRAPMLAEDFEKFLDERPELRNIMALDPQPEHNPALVQAIAEFFTENVIEDYGFDSMEHNLSVILDYAAVGLKLVNGTIQPGLAREIGEEIGLSIADGHDTGPVAALHDVLTRAGLIQHHAQIAGLSPLGSKLADDHPGLIAHLANELPRSFSDTEWPSILLWLAAGSGTTPLIDAPEPADTSRATNVFVGLGVLEPQEGHPMTGSGQRFLARLLERHADQV